MVQSHKGVQRRPDSPSGGATGSIGDAAAGARATVRNVGFAEGEAALSPRVEGARPKGDRPALIGAKGKEGAGTILPGGAARGGAPQLGPKNADGLVTGVVATQDQPRVFMNGGKTGSDTIYWSGGTGGRGEQFVSSIDVVVGGSVVTTLPVTASTDDEATTPKDPLPAVQAKTIRFDADVPIPVAKLPSFVVVIVRGTRLLDDILPFMPVPPRAFTNPIWLGK